METASTEEKSAVKGYTIEELLSCPRGEIASLSSDKLTQTPPAIVASFLERLDIEEQRSVLRKLSMETASEILAEMDAEDSAKVLGAMREERAVGILEDFAPDDAADLVGELNEEDQSRLLDKLEPEKAETVKNLLSYPPDTAGGIMTPEVATVQAAMSVDEAIKHIRKLSKEMEDINYIYVVDAEGKLQGTISMRDLILANPRQKIGGIMATDLKGVTSLNTDREEVALSLAELNLLSLPVVDDQGRLQGIVTVDDVIDVLQDEATEDIQRLVGAGPSESIHDSILYSVKQRHPWLLVNLLTASLAAGVISFFQAEIEQFTLLAVFMPIIASMGGNTGSQTLAVAIRSLALGEVKDSDNARLCIKECVMGLINGAATGLFAALVTFFVTQSAMIALVIMVALILNMGLAGLAGAFIPLLLKKFKMDPAQSSAIFLTTITDVAGFFIFLSLGSFILL